MQLDDLTPDAALAALAWQVELGVTDAISETTHDRFEAPAKPAKSPEGTADASQNEAVVAPAAPDLQTIVQTAKAMAKSANDLKELRNAIMAFDGCELKKGARNLVFSDGNSAADIMIICEAPDRDEDREGKPFGGVTGQLLDNMFQAIGRGRASERPEDSIYVAPVIPWRPPQSRDPSGDEIAMMLPFLKRHIALVNPQVLVLMGNAPCAALLGKTGITRLRGQWAEVDGKPALPMLHPGALIRQPSEKRLAWADLKSLRAKLKDPS